MAHKRNPVLWDQWHQRIERQRVSGLSIAEFCRREGVSQATFFTWKRRFRGSTPAPQAEQVRTARTGGKKRSVVRRQRTENPATAPSPPTRPADFLQLPVWGMRTSPWIEMTLVDGTLIRVPQENVAALIALLRVLRGDDPAVWRSEAHHA